MAGAFIAAALFGLGTVCIGHLHRLVIMETFADAMRITIPYFLAVYLVVALISLVRPGRRYSLFGLWSGMAVRGRVYLIAMTAGNAASGWCFFAMLKRIDPVTASLIMALSVILNFVLTRILLGEDTGFSTRVGRNKWASFALIFAGVLLSAVYSVIHGNNPVKTGIPAVVIGILSAMFASVRMVCAKGVFVESAKKVPAGGSEKSNGGSPAGLSMAVNRFAYAGALVISLIALPLLPAGDRAFPASLLPHPFLLVVAGVYGLAYAFWYSSLMQLEASRMQLITRSNSVFAALLMLAAYHFLGIGEPPSWIQVPAAVLVIAGAALASRNSKN